MRIMDYNRVVKDLNGLSTMGFLARLTERFVVSICSPRYRPMQRGEFSLYLPGQWYRLTINPHLIPTEDPVARLDVSLLSDNLLGPVLGIKDLRRDKRIDFVAASAAWRNWSGASTAARWRRRSRCTPPTWKT